MRLKVTNDASAWRGQEGEFVRMEDGSEAPSSPDSVVVVRMPGNRAVEFKASDLAPVKDEAEAEAE
jgi:hypothetical protein